MTEDEWMSCTNPDKMTGFLRRKYSISVRKWPLFGCGCCRVVWHLLDDEGSKNAVEVGEGCADGVLFASDLRVAGDAAKVLFTQDRADNARLLAKYAALACVSGMTGYVERFAADYAARASAKTATVSNCRSSYIA
jgi:hypothetical protein